MRPACGSPRAGRLVLGGRGRGLRSVPGSRRPVPSRPRPRVILRSVATCAEASQDQWVPVPLGSIAPRVEALGLAREAEAPRLAALGAPVDLARLWDGGRPSSSSTRVTAGRARPRRMCCLGSWLFRGSRWPRSRRTARRTPRPSRGRIGSPIGASRCSSTPTRGQRPSPTASSRPRRSSSSVQVGASRRSSRDGAATMRTPSPHTLHGSPARRSRSSRPRPTVPPFARAEAPATRPRLGRPVIVDVASPAAASTTPARR